MRHSLADVVAKWQMLWPLQGGVSWQMLLPVADGIATGSFNLIKFKFWDVDQNLNIQAIYKSGLRGMHILYWCIFSTVHCNLSDRITASSLNIDTSGLWSVIICSSLEKKNNCGGIFIDCVVCLEFPFLYCYSGFQCWLHLFLQMLWVSILYCLVLCLFGQFIL